MSLPAQVLFSVSESNNEARYLSFTGPQRQLRFGQEGVFSDLARFAVESAGNGLVHIRSCYENNYWARASRFEPWLVASSPEKVEDMTKDECTLFRPRISAGNVFVEFIHPQSGLNVVMRPATDAQAYNLCVEHDAPTQFRYTDFAVISRTKLPRYVTFLGDNNMYLSARRIVDNVGLLHFSQYQAVTNREVGFEVSYNNSSDNVRIKSMSLNNHFWYVSVADPRVLVSSQEMDRESLFDAVASSPPNTVEPGIAFRSVFFNRYCHRSQSSGHNYVIGTNSSPNDRNSWLRPMILGDSNSRRVNIGSYRHAFRELKSSRIVRTLNIGNNTNHVIEREETVEYSKLRAQTVSNSMSMVRYSASFIGRIPDIDSNGELVIPNRDTQFTTTWGSPTTQEVRVRERVSIKIPPMTTVTATVTVNRAAFEVPFSYEQFDRFPWGDTQTQHLHDGVFKIEYDYGSGVIISENRTFNSEEFDDGNLRKELPVVEDEGNNVQEDGIEPKASDEVNTQGNNVQEDGIEPKASDEVNEE